MTSTKVAQGARVLIPRGRPPGPWKRRRAGCWLRQRLSCGKRTRGRRGSWSSPSAWLCCGARTPTKVEAGKQLLTLSIGQGPHTDPQANLYKMATPGHAESGAGNSCAQGSVEPCLEPQGRYWGKGVEKEYTAAIRGLGPSVPSGAKSSVSCPPALQSGAGRAGPDQWRQRLPSSGTSATRKQTSSWGQKYSYSGELCPLLLLLPCSRHSLFK